jgi:hypothetical protein
VVDDVTVPCHTPGVVFVEPAVPPVLPVLPDVGLEPPPPPQAVSAKTAAAAMLAASEELNRVMIDLPRTELMAQPRQKRAGRIRDRRVPSSVVGGIRTAAGRRSAPQSH